MTVPFELKRAARKFLWITNRRALLYVRFIDSHYTMLSIVVVGTLGTTLTFLFSYFLRYNRFDWWRWKSRAVWGSVRLWGLLILIKGGLQVLL